ncbi:MAG: ribonuclease R [Parvibaculaceae bacterium]
MAKRALKKPPSTLPREDEILAFLAKQEGKPGKREIARAFGLRSSAEKMALKAMLKRMTTEGTLKRSSRKFSDPRRLPPVAVLNIGPADADGELTASPAEWDPDDGQPPRILVRWRGDDGPPPRTGDRILARLRETEDADYPYEARLLRRLAARATRILGVLRPSGSDFRLVPADKKARGELDVLAADSGGAVPGELVAAETYRDTGRGLIRARVLERLGSMDDQRNISLIAIHEHGIPNRFPDAVLAETTKLKLAGTAGRVDIRSLPLVTIDPADARDHDDAVYAEADEAEDNPGGVKVVVAIADVAHYVRSGTALDREARLRGNSVYFPDRVVPMLPERISNDLCSLVEGKDRPALACFMTFDRLGRKRAHRFERVLMRSQASLTYEQAQAATDGRPDDMTGPLMESALKPLWNAYNVLMAGRRRREPLELDIPERKLVLDAHGMIERVVTPERLDSHRLIEEFMIQANVAAAEALESKRSPVMYRVHEAPSREKLAALNDFLSTVGLTGPKGQVVKPSNFNRILAMVAGKENQHLVNEVVLRTQAQAVYSPENAGHFGLNLRRYAHFTSPIRRYADLLVHRALITAFGFGKDGLSAEDVEGISETADIISAAERRAMAAERDTVDRLIASHLKGQVGARFSARIGGVVGAGLFVKLDESGADGFVPVSTLGSDYYVLDSAQRALIGRDTGETYRLGDPVEVLLREATPVAGGLRFEMLSDGRKGKKPPKGLRTVRRAGPPRRRR